MNAIIPRYISSLEDEIAKLEGVNTNEVKEEEVEVEQKPQVEVETKPLDKDEETFKKRYSDLRRFAEKEKQTHLDEIEALRKQLSEKSKTSLPSADEAEEWARANPKAASIIRAIALGEVEEPNKELSKVQLEVHKIKQETQIRKAVPDFDEVVEDEDFHSWANSQPRPIQDMVFGNKADDVIWAIKQYKKTLDKPVDTNKEAALAVKKTGTSVPPEGNKTVYRESQVNRMSLAEYEKNEEAIQTAIRNGSFVYDLSGAAR